jgi:predicted TIM-barrel fold metal-dependent hydrolase
MMSEQSEERYVVISADTHCGADLLDYKPYLEQRYHEEFDAWASDYSDAWGAIDVEDDDYRAGIASFASEVNWNSAKRLAHLEGEGIAAEVLFPNTTPPFFPSGMVSAPAPSDPPRDRHEYELRFAGIRAHNRWLADFCRELPGRRAGHAQIFLSDVDDTVSEIKRAREDGLKAVLLPPDHTESLTRLYLPKYEPVWSLCEDLDMPIGRHGVVVGEANSAPASATIGLIESSFFSSRALTSLLMSGVFARHPKLRFILTELGASWVPGYLANLDGFFEDSKVRGTLSYMFGSVVGEMDKRPSEYFQTNCYLGTFLTPADIDMRHEIGVDRMMWGGDYPHHEGTSPLSRKALRYNFSSVEESEVRQMLSENAASCYGFDLSLLEEVAQRIGPTVHELRQPLSKAEFPSYPDETICPTFVPSAVPQVEKVFA